MPLVTTDKLPPHDRLGMPPRFPGPPHIVPGDLRGPPPPGPRGFPGPPPPHGFVHGPPPGENAIEAVKPGASVSFIKEDKTIMWQSKEGDMICIHDTSWVLS